MSKPQLHELYDWLKLEGRNRFEIYNVENSQAIEKCASYNDLTKNGQTLEDYFHNLVVKKGIKQVQIVKKHKHGSTYVREGCGLNFALSTDANNNVAASGSQAMPGATPQQTQHPGLMGSASTGSIAGLGFPEIMQMRSQADRYQETKDQNLEFKTKIELLEKENKRLETECLTNKLGNEGKPSSLDKILEGLASNPSAIPGIIQSIKGTGGTAPGLNSPTPQQLSDIKSQVVDLISRNQQVTDNHVAAANYVLVQAITGNQSFMDEYFNLLQQHNIIQNGSDNSNHSNT